MTDYDNAKFYDARETDVFSLETPEEAICEVVDGWCHRRGSSSSDTTIDAIRKTGPITVKAYGPKQLTAVQAFKLAESAVVLVAETIDDVENFGDPDGEQDPLDGRACDSLVLAFAADIMRIWREHADPWQRECVGERTYSVEEVEAICREECPKWFEEEDPAPTVAPKETE